MPRAAFEQDKLSGQRVLRQPLGGGGFAGEVPGGGVGHGGGLHQRADEQHVLSSL